MVLHKWHHLHTCVLHTLTDVCTSVINMRPSTILVILMLGLGAKSVTADFQLLVLHNNDMHARFEEVDESAQPCSLTSSKKSSECFGGFARMRQAASDAIEEAKSRNISAIFLNAGDSFQGTAYYALQKWRTAPLVDSLGIDVMVS